MLDLTIRNIEIIEKYDISELVKYKAIAVLKILDLNNIVHKIYPYLILDDYSIVLECNGVSEYVKDISVVISEEKFICSCTVVGYDYYLENCNLSHISNVFSGDSYAIEKDFIFVP